MTKITNLKNQQQQNEAPRNISVALLVYMFLITLIVTLAPFKFHIPQAYRWFWFTDPMETFQNMVLFAPLGFLYMASLRNPDIQNVIIAGAAAFVFSLSIEIVQMFVPGRYSSLIDVANNTFGSGAAALFYLFSTRFLRKKAAGVLWLEIPLGRLLIMHIPLMWLCGMAMDKELNRLWLLLLPGFSGAIILTEIYKNRLYGRTFFSRGNMALVFSGWFFIATVPALAVFPLRVLVVLYLPIIVFVLLRLRSIRNIPLGRSRFELETLAKVWPLIFFYLFLIGQWPLTPLQWPMQFGWLDPELFKNDRLVTIMRIIEYIAAFTLAGYMVAEQTSRIGRERIINGYTFWVILAMAMVFETARGLHPGHGASLWGFVISLGGALFGAFIYGAVLLHFRKLRDRKTHPDTLDVQKRPLKQSG